MHPTLERVAKAHGSIEVGQGGTRRLTDWPIRILADKGLLGNEDETERRRDAAERFYAHYYHGNLNPLRARDYRQPFAGLSNAFSIAPASERQARHRRAYRDALKALRGPNGVDRTTLATFMVVCEEKTILETGAAILNRRDREQVRAIVIEFVKDGLDRLIAHWKR